MKYTFLSNEELIKLAPQLIPHVVRDNEKFWFVKYKPGSRDEDKRDLLTYLLGKNICNIAEVKLLSDIEFIDIKSHLRLPQESTCSNTFLVRLASSYSLDELPNKTIERAVATELVYSVWIRRRDTHSDNRVYVEGVPIFFDHQTTFLSEPHYAHSTVFFMHNPDHGHPPSWRVKEVPRSETMDTDKARNVTNKEKAYHYIYDINIFKKELRVAEEVVIKLAMSNISQVIASVGFVDAEVAMINNFLAKNLETLKSDLKHMEEIIFLP